MKLNVKVEWFIHTARHISTQETLCNAAYYGLAFIAVVRYDCHFKA